VIRDQTWSARIEDAVERFNASDSAHTVAGLIRTLGPPRVSIGAAAGSPSEVRITVAWELSGYQWVVDVADPDRPVFELACGGELGELDGAARIWNGGATEGGKVFVGRAAPIPLGRRQRLLRALS
jgi:hypothetical protein